MVVMVERIVRVVVLGVLLLMRVEMLGWREEVLECREEVLVRCELLLLDGMLDALIMGE